MARYVRWRNDEFESLIELVEAEGRFPSQSVLAEFSSRLRLRARERGEPRVDEPQFRSVGSIRSQIGRLVRARRDPTRADIPVALREVLAEHEAAPRPLRPDSIVDDDWSRQQADPFIADRKDLVTFLDEARTLFAELSERGGELLAASKAAEFRQAWSHLTDSGVVDRAQVRLGDADLGPALAAAGLVEAPRRLKVNGFRRAYESFRRYWTWERLRPLLKWANVLLGSLARVLPFLEPVKEFKESWEAAAEEAYEAA